MINDWQVLDIGYLPVETEADIAFRDRLGKITMYGDWKALEGFIEKEKLTDHNADFIRRNYALMRAIMERDGISYRRGKGV